MRSATLPHVPQTRSLAPPHVRRECLRRLRQNLGAPGKRLPHPKRKRQACSARRCKSHNSHRVRAWARALMKCCVVGEHLPPTSTARTTRRDLARRPTSSGYLRSFRRSAMEITTPSLWAAPILAVPSQCRALTSVVSTASWAPETVATLPLRVGVHRLRWVRGGPSHATARLYSHGHPPLQIRATTLSRAPPPPQDPCPCAASAVMAISIEWAATSARTHGQKEAELAPASCCQPAPHLHSNSSTSFLAGLAPATTSRQDGGSNLTLTNSCSLKQGVAAAPSN